MKNRKTLPALMVTIVLAAFIAGLTTPYMGFASFSYALIILGVASVKNRIIHLRLMSTGAAIDVALVLILQIQRSAMQTVVSGELNIYQMIHISTGTAAILLYGPTIWLGRRALAAGRPSTTKRPPHVYMGKLTFVLRTISFLFMFSQLSRVVH